MATITTIPVKRETRALLEPLKGKKTWDEFLLELAELKMRSIKRDLRELRRLVDLDSIRRSEWAR